MLPLNEPALRNFWYPIIPIAHLLDGPRNFLLLGTTLVLWIDPDDRPYAAIDRCCHRSAKLSSGRVTEQGELECPYHGWRFNSSGQCCMIPQHPDKKIPDTFRIKTFLCLEKYGYVWICLSDNPILPIPDFAEETDPAFRQIHGFYEEWNCAALRYVENALDNCHQHFVHKELLDTPSPISNSFGSISETTTGLIFSNSVTFENNNLLGDSIDCTQSQLICQRILEWYAPFGVALRMTWPNGLRHHIFSFAIPKDNSTTQFVRFYFRNDENFQTTDDSVIQFDRKLLNQDRGILEVIDLDTPLDGVSECSMEEDKPILMMRRILARLFKDFSATASNT